MTVLLTSFIVYDHRKTFLGHEWLDLLGRFLEWYVWSNLIELDASVVVNFHSFRRFGGHSSII